jgi:hypothetical protein
MSLPIALFNYLRAAIVSQELAAFLVAVVLLVVFLVAYKSSVQDGAGQP